MKIEKSCGRCLLFALALMCGVHHLAAQGTAFTYQGQLDVSGGAANGLYDFRFRLSEDNQGSTYAGTAVLTNAVPVTNGFFTATIDFGTGLFTGTNYWLEVDVRTNGSGGYSELYPLQAITPTPYSIFANTASNVLGTVQAAQIGGTVLNSSLPGSPTFSGTVAAGAFSGNGASLTSVNALTLNGLRATNFWQLSGNSGTTAGVDFVGTTDNQALEFHVNALRALWLEPGGPSTLAGTNTPTGAPNLIGGSPANFVAAGVVGAVIAGGGATNFAGAAYTNLIGSTSDFSTISGGRQNTIQTSSHDSTIAGGQENFILTNSAYAVIGGGYDNTISSNGSGSTIAGGYYNVISNNDAYYPPEWSVVSGGYQNLASGYLSTVGGGYINVASGENATVGGGGGYYGGDGNTASGGWSTVAGGYDNIASGYESILAGGAYNNAAGDNSTVSGGYGNSIIAGATYSTIGGGAGNIIETNANGSTIAGGADNTIYVNDSFVGGGQDNVIETNSDHSVLTGGWNNNIGQKDYEATIAGGYVNVISNNSGYSSIGGGIANIINSNAFDSTISGGDTSSIGINSDHSTIAGGGNNVILTNCNGATIAGGQHNTVGNTSPNAFVAGGYGNTATGNCTFAAGNLASVANANSFVWGDGSATTTSTVSDSVTFRASGGYRFFTGNSTAGATLTGTSWTAISDRNAKKNFQPVDTLAVLNKLAAIPIQQWNYKWEKDTDVPNIGPMAQDFKHAFYPGRDDKGISTLEFDGVELAAIQGLNQKLNERDATIQKQGTEIEQLKQSLEELKETVSQLKHDKLASR